MREGKKKPATAGRPAGNEARPEREGRGALAPDLGKRPCLASGTDQAPGSARPGRRSRGRPRDGARRPGRSPAAATDRRRRRRDRYWGSEMTEDKAAAYTTLYTVLVTLAKLLAPYTPFMAEMMYRNLVPAFYPEAPQSVHLCDFPAADESLIDLDLQMSMYGVLMLVAAGRSARNAGNLKNRQPLAEMLVASTAPLGLNEEMIAVVLDELNVKKMTFVEDGTSLLKYVLKPQLRTLGPKYGKRLGEITKFLATCNGAEVVAAVRGGGSYTIPLDPPVVLLEEDLQFFTESPEGYSVAINCGIIVALDTRLTEELLNEGCERELVSKIQTMRKEAGFEVTDRIDVYFAAGEGRAKKMLSLSQFAGDVLANSVTEGSAEGFTREVDVNGEKVTLTLVKA